MTLLGEKAFPPERLHALESRLVLFHAHESRPASQILDEQVE
jgi:hypothetical protein